MYLKYKRRNERLKKIIIIIGLIIISLVGFVIIFFNPARLTPEDPKGKTMYYTQIKNEEITIDDSKRFEYILDCYDTNGYKKSLTFTSGKKLREDAYIELYVAPLRGVTYWQEVKWDELHVEVQKIYIN